MLTRRATCGLVLVALLFGFTEQTFAQAPGQPYNGEDRCKEDPSDVRWFSIYKMIKSLTSLMHRDIVCLKNIRPHLINQM